MKSKKTKSKKLSIFPSQIIVVKHYDRFAKEEAVHPFVVWKRQGFDSAMKNNVYAFRITTNTLYGNYKVGITPNKNNNLSNFSFVCVDSIFLFPVDDCEVIGQLDSDDFYKVIDARNKVHCEELEEAFHTYKNMLCYEMKR